MLQVQGLSVYLTSKEGRQLLSEVSFEVPDGEIHLLLGKNGSGKSTLFSALSGLGDLETEGVARLSSVDLLSLGTSERFHQGLFLAHQNPVTISGLSSLQLLRSSLNAKRAKHAQPPLDPADFLAIVSELSERLRLPLDMLKRSFNEGFSGGEKRRHEILQMLVLEPEFVLLDEVDSGLDFEGSVLVAEVIREFIQGKSNLIGQSAPPRGALVVTHNPKFAQLLSPSRAYVLSDGVLRVHDGPVSTSAFGEE